MTTTSITSSMWPLISGICRFTSTYPKYRMVGPLVPSSFSSLSTVWTFRAICSQNLKLILETCTPESINVISLCPSTMTDASLDHPTRWVIGSGLRKGMKGVSSCLSLCLVAFIFTDLGPGLWWECEGLTVSLGHCHCLGGGPHSLRSPQTGLKWMLGQDIPWSCGSFSPHLLPHILSEDCRL